MVGDIASPKIVAYSIPLNGVISKSICNPGRKSTAASSNVPAAKAPMLHRKAETVLHFLYCDTLFFHSAQL